MSRHKTWRQHYAPIIARRIHEIMKEQPDIEAKRLRWLLGRENPGQYKHMKGIWANECTRQVAMWKTKKIVLVGKMKKDKTPKEQTKLF